MSSASSKRDRALSPDRGERAKKRKPPQDRALIVAAFGAEIMSMVSGEPSASPTGERGIEGRGENSDSPPPNSEDPEGESYGWIVGHLGKLGDCFTNLWSECGAGKDAADTEFPGKMRYCPFCRHNPRSEKRARAHCLGKGACEKHMLQRRGARATGPREAGEWIDHPVVQESLSGNFARKRSAMAARLCERLDPLEEQRVAEALRRSKAKVSKFSRPWDTLYCDEDCYDANILGASKALIAGLKHPYGEAAQGHSLPARFKEAGFDAKARTLLQMGQVLATAMMAAYWATGDSGNNLHRAPRKSLLILQEANFVSIHSVDLNK